jgi:tetratricopeptide (TPR) repeat protein
MNDNVSAERCLRKALEIEPSNSEAMYNLAEVIRCSREEPAPVEAVELYRKSLAIHPDYAESYRGLALVFFDSKQFEEAEEYARRALKLETTDWAAHTLLGELLVRRGKLKAARKELQRGAELAPFIWEAQSRLASFYEDHGSLSETLQAFRTCLDLDPDNAWANRRYGATLACMGRGIEARVFLKRALALDPADQFAPEYLRKLERSHAHRRVTGRRGKTKRTLTKPHNP